ncbi:MAG: flavodoxin family protein [Dehalococcoidales bacterium]|jgi:multimeric flavodoxin WrbA
MAMKVIGVCGSPRKGNTEWMLDTLFKELERGGAETEMLLLRKLDVQMCRGCLACEKKGKDRKGDCIIKDHMTAVYPKLLAADAIVLATPGYMGLLSGRLKNFLDRTCAVWPGMEGKLLAGLAVAEESTGQSMQNLRYYASYIKFRWVGGVTALAKNPGDAAKIPGLEGRLRRLARKILTA